MKLGTVESIKFKKLKLKLGLAQWQAIGLLEALWMFTARNAPLGDIGQHSNDDIATHLEWVGDPEVLIAALIDCRWLDVSNEYRLLVHDWDEHLPVWLQGNLKRHGKQPISTKQPAEQSAQQNARQCATAEYSEEAAHSLLSSPLTSSDDLNTHTGRETFLTSPSKAFESFYAAYPRRNGKREAWKAWQEIVAQLMTDREQEDSLVEAFLIDRAGAYAGSPAGMPPPPGDDDFRKSPANWLRGGHYDDDPSEWTRPNKKGSGNGSDRGRNQAAPSGRHTNENPAADTATLRRRKA